MGRISHPVTANNQGQRASRQISWLTFGRKHPWCAQRNGFDGVLHAILLMEEILHQLIGSLSHYLQGFIHTRWLAGFLNHQQ